MAKEAIMKRLVFAALVLGATVALADVEPGDVIGKDNFAKAKDLVGPGVAWCVDHGMTMKIVPT